MNRIEIKAQLEILDWVIKMQFLGRNKLIDMKKQELELRLKELDRGSNE